MPQKAQLAKDEQQATAIISGRKRGKGGKRPASLTFPSWSLKDALRVAQSIWDNNAGNPYPIMDIASKLNYSPTTGIFRELIRAAQRYGLTNETYSQDLTSTISLTPLGSSLVAPQPDEDVNALKRKALETPELFRAVFESIQGKVIPPPDSMKNLLIRTYHLSQADAEQCNIVLNKNITELGIAEDHAGKAYLRLDKLGMATPSAEAQPAEAEEEKAPPDFSSLAKPATGTVPPHLPVLLLRRKSRNKSSSPTARTRSRLSRQSRSSRNTRFPTSSQLTNRIEVAQSVSR